MTFHIPDNLKYESGVYILRSTVTDDTYIGSTYNFLDRFINHLAASRKGYPAHTKLRAYITQHGAETLRFECLEHCPTTYKARQREGIHIRTLQPSLNTYRKS